MNEPYLRCTSGGSVARAVNIPLGYPHSYSDAPLARVRVRTRLSEDSGLPRRVAKNKLRTVSLQRILPSKNTPHF